jgi:hypothetical protein
LLIQLVIGVEESWNRASTVGRRCGRNIIGRRRAKKLLALYKGRASEVGREIREEILEGG